MGKFNQHRTKEIIAVLRKHARDGKRIHPKTATDAADLIEDMIIVVYGIQERFPIQEEVKTKEEYL